MKPRNFPARRLARQLAAKEGGSCRHYLINDKRVLAARQSRSKKRSTGAVA